MCSKNPWSKRNFNPKKGLGEESEKVLSSCSLNLSHYDNYEHFLPNPSFVHRVDAKRPVFRDGGSSPLFSVHNSNLAADTP
jgi:hypothetical protein